MTYNVISYYVSAEALIACGIVRHCDELHADAAITIAYSPGYQCVLPVCRHVIGLYGGRYEGGEQVGVGIGQAIYKPLAMRHRAADESLAIEPGIRGLLDFLVSRIRPDAAVLRWGDGGWFRRVAPGRTPFSLEYRHAAPRACIP